MNRQSFFKLQIFCLLLIQVWFNYHFVLGNIEHFTVTLNPVNDICTNAIPIVPAAGNAGCVPDTLFFSTDGTTDSGTNASCSGANTGKDQFFT